MKTLNKNLRIPNDVKDIITKATFSVSLMETVSECVFDTKVQEIVETEPKDINVYKKTIRDINNNLQFITDYFELSREIVSDIENDDISKFDEFKKIVEGTFSYTNRKSQNGMSEDIDDYILCINYLKTSFLQINMVLR